MSGRLIILPKKTYCPWNPKNVERVLRDERLHAEEQAKQQQDNQLDQSKARLQALKKNHNQSEESSGHVNLFAPEEEKALQQLQVATKNKKKSQEMIQPLYLGQSAKKAGEAFSLRHQKQPPSNPIKVQEKFRDDRRKSRMDPMHRFHSSGECHQNAAPLHEEQPSSSPGNPVDRSSTRKESKHKKKRKRRRKDISDSSSESSSNESCEDDRKHRKRRRRLRKERKDRTHSRKSKVSAKRDDSIEELRRRRIEREEKERQRQQSIVDDAKYRPASHKYSDQYNPTLSRR